MVNYTEAGVLSPAGGLIFGGGMDGDFMALDAETGKPLWHVYLAGANTSGPISYAVDGKQCIVGTCSGAMFAFTARFRTPLDLRHKGRFSRLLNEY